MALAGSLAAPFAGSQLLALALTTVVAVGAGAEVHARLHPRFGPVSGRQFDGFWIGPALASLASVLAAGRLEPSFGRIVPFVGALIVGALIFGQDRELDGRREEKWTPLAYALSLYLVSFSLFVEIYGSRMPMLVGALATGASATLLGAALYRPSRSPRARVALFALLSGLCVAELTAALNFWIVAGLIGGSFLLLFFYVSAGLIQALLERSLDTRLAVEYALVGLVGLALIVFTTPWRS